MSKSKKGSQFEREICKLLSLWWSENDRDDLFWRTAQSGGRATTRRKQGKRTADSAADMMATHESSKPFTKTCLIEMKRGYSDKYKIVKNKKGFANVKKVSHGLEVLTILDKQPYNKDPIVLDWWKKLESERKATRRRFSFIIFRRDTKLACIVMDKKTYEFLCKRNGSYTCRQITFNFDTNDQLPTLVIVKLDEFLAWCQPSCFIDKKYRQIKRRKERKIKRRR